MAYPSHWRVKTAPTAVMALRSPESNWTCVSLARCAKTFFFPFLEFTFLLHDPLLIGITAVKIDVIRQSGRICPPGQPIGDGVVLAGFVHHFNVVPALKLVPPATPPQRPREGTKIFFVPTLQGLVVGVHGDISSPNPTFKV